MSYLNKVLYRKYLADARQARRDINAPAWHCIDTRLDFNAKTRNASFWGCIARIQQLRATS
jgi:hypothetical protein